jgi:hypothetical protein
MVIIADQGRLIKISRGNDHAQIVLERKYGVIGRSDDAPTAKPKILNANTQMEPCTIFHRIGLHFRKIQMARMSLSQYRNARHFLSPTPSLQTSTP